MPTAERLALARFELTRDGRLAFTDDLSLSEFGDSRRIVSRIFYRHP